MGRITQSARLKKHGLPYKSSSEKVGINQLWATTISEHKKKYMYDNARVLILDAEEMQTTNHLLKAGFRARDITAPNINPDVVQILRSHGVNSTFNTIGRYLRRAHPTIPYFWLDAMCTLNGNELGHRPCADVDTYLRRDIGGDNCIIGVTICNRSKNTRTNVAPQIEMMQHQMEAIFGGNGYSYTNLYLDTYKRNMVFGLWELNRSADAVRKPLLRAKHSRQPIGFPVGYDVSHLQ